MLSFFIGVMTVLEVIMALLLIGIVLIQQTKAGGGLGAMGGGMTETVFGASAGNVLTKATVILAALFLTNTLMLAIITGHSGQGKSLAESLPDAPDTVEASDAEALPPAGTGEEGEAAVATEAEKKVDEAAPPEAKPAEQPSVPGPAADVKDAAAPKPEAKPEAPAAEAKPPAEEKADDKAAKPE